MQEAKRLVSSQCLPRTSFTTCFDWTMRESRSLTRPIVFRARRCRNGEGVARRLRRDEVRRESSGGSGIEYEALLSGPTELGGTAVRLDPEYGGCVCAYVGAVAGGRAAEGVDC